MSDKYASVISKSRIRLARNAENVNFPHLLSASNSATNTIFEAVKDAAGAIYKDAVGVKMCDLSPANRAYLTEGRLISKELSANTATGALVTADDYAVSIMINEEDHIREQYVEDGLNLKSAYEKAKKLDREIGKRIKFAFDEKLGYLTVCPTNLGTGMRASAMMFLPALTLEKRMNAAIKNCNMLGLTVRGAMGEGSEAEAFVYQLSNQKTLGIDENETIKLVEKVARQIAENELEARKELIEKYGVTLEDKIMRCYGELSYARKISTKELMDKIGYIKLGIALGLIEGDLLKLDNAIVQAQPAHIATACGKETGEYERDIKRAELICGAIRACENKH